MKPIAVALGTAVAALVMATVLPPPASSAAAPVPYTSAQAAAGAHSFSRSCAACHGAQLQGVSAPALRGAAIGISQESVGELFTYISQQMPLTNPGGLPARDYVNIVAYLLASNGRSAGGALLTASAAKASTALVRP